MEKKHNNNLHKTSDSRGNYPRKKQKLHDEREKERNNENTAQKVIASKTMTVILLVATAIAIWKIYPSLPIWDFIAGR